MPSVRSSPRGYADRSYQTSSPPVSRNFPLGPCSRSATRTISAAPPSRSADPCLLPVHGGYVRIGPVVQQEGEVDDQDGSQRNRIRGKAIACKPAKLPSSFSLTFTNREVTSTGV